MEKNICEREILGMKGGKIKNGTKKVIENRIKQIEKKYGEGAFEKVLGDRNLGLMDKRLDLYSLWLCGNEKEKEEWKNEVKKIAKEYVESIRWRDQNQNEKKKFTSRGELEKMIVSYINEMKNFPGNVNISRRCLYACLYIIQPPLRNMEYYSSVIVKDENELKDVIEKIKKEEKVVGVEVDGEKKYCNVINLETGKMDIYIYKLSRYGSRQIDLDARVVQILGLWKHRMENSKYGIPWLAINARKNGRMNESQYRRDVKIATGGISSRYLRKMYVSWFVGKYYNDLERRKWLAKQMLHSEVTQEFCYHIYRDENRKVEDNIIDEWIPFISKK